MSYDPGRGGRILVRVPDSISTTVNIAAASGRAITVYTDVTRTTSVAMPDVITAAKYYFVDSDDSYVVSVKAYSVEVGTVGDNSTPATVALSGDTLLSVQVDEEAVQDAYPKAAGGLYPSFVSLVPSGDSTGAKDTAALQAAVTGAAANTTVVLSGTGTYYVDTIAITNKAGLTISAPSAAVKRVASPTGHLFIVSGCTNFKSDIAEIDGNNFAGGAAAGEAYTVIGCTGVRITGYIHHTWNHAVAHHTTSSTSVYIDIRAEFIGAGYNLDPTFNATFPHGCGVYFSAAAPVTRGVVKIRGTDFKGGGAVYVGGCDGLNIDIKTRRHGYRGVFLAGTATCTGVKIADFDVQECGVLYEIAPAASGGHNPGDSLYGQGTNAIYPGPAPVTAQDCVVTGGKAYKCGENAVEGLAIVTGVTGDTTGFAYPSFGAGVAKSGFYPYKGGSKVQNCTTISAAGEGIANVDSAATDIYLVHNTIVDPGTYGIRFQALSGTSSRLVTRGNTIIQKTSSPTYGIRCQASSGTFDNTCLVEDNLILGTFSTSNLTMDASGGGVNNTVNNNNDPATPALAKTVTFTGSGTATKPTWAKNAEVTSVGAGGGGGGGGSALSSGGTATQVGAGGGGAGTFSTQVVDVSAITSLTVTIGAAGASGPGGAANSNAGTAGGLGGDTTVGGTGISVVGRGGHGGAASAANSTTTVGGGTWGPVSVSTAAAQIGQGGSAGTGGGTSGGYPIGAGGGGGAGGSPAGSGNGGNAGGPGTMLVGGSFNNSQQASNANGANASDAATTSFGAGGGGGGGGAPTGTGGNGGKGGPGYAIIRWLA